MNNVFYKSDQQNLTDCSNKLLNTIVMDITVKEMSEAFNINQNINQNILTLDQDFCILIHNPT